MALFEIACPKCGHRGFTGELPRMMRCCACQHFELFRSGERAVRAVVTEPGGQRRERPAEQPTPAKQLTPADHTGRVRARHARYSRAAKNRPNQIDAGVARAIGQDALHALSSALSADYSTLHPR
jgi:hypothetical protein